MCLAIATASSPAGPFTDKGAPLICGSGFVNIDPMQFDDPATGKKYLYWGSGFQPIKVQELSADRLNFAAASQPVDLISPIADPDLPVTGILSKEPGLSIGTAFTICSFPATIAVQRPITL